MFDLFYNTKVQKILITGVCGFVGFHLVKRLAPEADVYGIDLMPAPGSIHAHRLEEIQRLLYYSPVDIREHARLGEHIKTIQPDVVIHLAACTGIAPSETNRQLYFDTNVVGFSNLLQHCTNNNVPHLIYASSSSVYSHKNEVYRESDAVENQISYYGKTKRYAETLAANYSTQFGIRCIGLRFFTVYGSWVRTDMAAWKFMKAISRKQPCVIYNEGNVYRDFTHVSDIVESIYLLIHKILSKKEYPLHEIYNIGYGSPVSVLDYVQTIAQKMGIEPHLQFAPLPSNELLRTHADTTKLQQAIGFTPRCNIEDGIAEMVDWFNRNGNKFV